ncbi:hypothetical protein KDA11_02200, partial [Candidatus Saccharibacteria bacterium]|nr:hypothetical protein [Candidatus Saccharibacteria bacterium]
DINTGSTIFITTELNTADIQGNVTNIKTNEYVMDLSIIDSDDSENQPPDVQYKAAIAPQFTPSGKIIYKYMDVTMPFVFNESRWSPDPNSMSGSVNLNIINVDGTADTILLSTPVVSGMMDIFPNYNMPSVQSLPGNNTNNSNNHNNSNNTNTVTLTNPVNKKLIQLSTPENTNITCSTADKEDSLAQQDSDYQYPVGLVNFCFDTNQTDNTITLTFVTDLRPEQVKARKYDSTNNTYVNLPDSSSPTITATTYDNQPALVLSYTITDNGALDLDDTIGSIKDPVGLAITNELAGQLANTGATAISTTALLAIAAVATGVRVVVRRRG